MCQILSSDHAQQDSGQEPLLTPVTGPDGAPRRIPAQSVVWLPQMAGTTPCPGEEEGGASETFPVSRLLVCSRCNICVHAACYRTTVRRGGGRWLCDRCVYAEGYTDNGSVTCCFCRKSGGALKRTTDNKASLLRYRGYLNINFSVADPACLSWIRSFLSRIRIFTIQDPH